MAYNLYSNFDPLVANGILPYSVNAVVNGNAPLYTDGPFNRSVPLLSKDIYTPSSASYKNNPNNWKKYAFATLVTVGTLLGLKKLGFNPVAKVKDAIVKVFKRH